LFVIKSKFQTKLDSFTSTFEKASTLVRVFRVSIPYAGQEPPTVKEKILQLRQQSPRLACLYIARRVGCSHADARRTAPVAKRKSVAELGRIVAEFLAGNECPSAVAARYAMPARTFY
jgi:hypothetical protein